MEKDHYEESNASNILISKISNLMIQNENYSENGFERTVPEKLKINNVKNKLGNELVENDNYQSVIEINKDDFSSNWRTSYSDEI